MKKKLKVGKERLFSFEYKYWWENRHSWRILPAFIPRIGFDMVPAGGLMHYLFFAKTMDKACNEGI